MIELAQRLDWGSGSSVQEQRAKAELRRDLATLEQSDQLALHGSHLVLLREASL